MLPASVYHPGREGLRGAVVSQLADHARRCPTTVSVVVLALLCLPLVLIGADHDYRGPVAALFALDPHGRWPDSGADALRLLVASGDWWRLFTPALLHFSFLHVAFNLALLWFFGIRLEPLWGTARFATALLALAAVSNTVQLWFSGHPLFGGLSGVVYGLFGALVVCGWRWPPPAVWKLPRDMSLGIFVLLALSSTGVAGLFGVHMAHAAHWSGLLFGGLLGLLIGPRRG